MAPLNGTSFLTRMHPQATPSKGPGWGGLPFNPGIETLSAWSACLKPIGHQLLPMAGSVPLCRSQRDQNTSRGIVRPKGANLLPLLTPENHPESLSEMKGTDVSEVALSAREAESPWPRSQEFTTRVTLGEFGTLRLRSPSMKWVMTAPTSQRRKPGTG